MTSLATAARAFKSVLQDILLASEGEKLSFMNLLLYLAPIAMVGLLPAALLMEENVISITVDLARKDIRVIWYLLFSSSLAYFLNLMNFLVTKHTSALTLQAVSLREMEDVALILQFVKNCELKHSIINAQGKEGCRMCAKASSICHLSSKTASSDSRSPIAETILIPHGRRARN